MTVAGNTAPGDAARARSASARLCNSSALRTSASGEQSTRFFAPAADIVHNKSTREDVVTLGVTGKSSKGPTLKNVRGQVLKLRNFEKNVRRTFERAAFVLHCPSHVVIAGDSGQRRGRSLVDDGQ